MVFPRQGNLEDRGHRLYDHPDSSIMAKKNMVSQSVATAYENTLPTSTSTFNEGLTFSTIFPLFIQPP